MFNISSHHIFYLSLQWLSNRSCAPDPRLNWIAMSLYWTKWKLIALACTCQLDNCRMYCMIKGCFDWGKWIGSPPIGWNVHDGDSEGCICVQFLQTQDSRVVFNAVNKAVYAPSLLPVILFETVMKSFLLKHWWYFGSRVHKAWLSATKFECICNMKSFSCSLVIVPTKTLVYVFTSVSLWITQ